MAVRPEVEEMLALYEGEHYAEALAKVDEFLVSFPNAARPWRFKAECLMKLDRFDEAIVCLDKLVSLGGAPAEGSELLRAVCHYNSFRYDEARLILATVASAPDQTPEIMSQVEHLMGLMGGTPATAPGAEKPS